MEKEKDCEGKGPRSDFWAATSQEEAVSLSWPLVRGREDGLMLPSPVAKSKKR